MDIEKFIKGVGFVASAFNPSIGGAVIGLGKVAEVLNNIDDNDLENIDGLSSISKGLRDIVAEDKFDKNLILQYAKRIDDISLILEKNFKLIK